ncbi:MAG: hypothetical protein HOQ21_01115, partial [Dermatophilaceae bacterium]|nr:hypothetical protein [Dermatophilaceae bacterium]
MLETSDETAALQSLLDASIARSTGHLRWTAHYGSSPFSWGDGTRMYRRRMTWAVAYAFKRDELMRARGVTARPGTAEQCPG